MSQDKEKKKELILEYKEKKAVGGVCSVTNTANDKVLILSGLDINSIKNKFEFSVQTGSCVSMKLKKDWDKFGAKKFEFAVLEEVEQEQGQSLEEFKEEINELEEMWSERFDEEELY